MSEYFKIDKSLLMFVIPVVTFIFILGGSFVSLHDLNKKVDKLIRCQSDILLTQEKVTEHIKDYRDHIEDHKELRKQVDELRFKDYSKLSSSIDIMEGSLWQQVP